MSDTLTAEQQTQHALNVERQRVVILQDKIARITAAIRYVQSLEGGYVSAYSYVRDADDILAADAIAIKRAWQAVDAALESGPAVLAATDEVKS